MWVGLSLCHWIPAFAGMTEWGAAGVTERGTTGMTEWGATGVTERGTAGVTGRGATGVAMRYRMA
jgi:hypothetical protein